MKRMLIGLITILALLGCDSLQDMTEVFEKQGLAQDTIKEKTGWDSQVGFNIHNGLLTNVSVTLNASDVRDKKVSELEEIVRKVVLETFKSKPQAIFIQIAVANDT